MGHGRAINERAEVLPIQRQSLSPTYKRNMREFLKAEGMLFAAAGPWKPGNPLEVEAVKESHEVNQEH